MKATTPRRALAVKAPASPKQPSVRALLARLAPWLKSVTHASVSEVGFFGVALRAAVTKNVEFARFVYAHSTPTETFFTSATLRGICEDLIALSFLNTLSKEDRDAAISLLMLRSVTDGVKAQTDFFKAERVWQPVLRPPKSDQSEVEQRLRALSAKLGWSGREPWPSVWFMAKAGRMTALYGYLYSATSRWVHFSPHLLLRMGWGGSAENTDNRTIWHFTTKNFSQYYADFNRVYSLYLLIRLLRGPGSTLLSPKSAILVGELESRLADVLRWPEIVTFEEMNVKGPHQLMRLLLKVAHEGSSGEEPDAAV